MPHYAYDKEGLITNLEWAFFRQLSKIGRITVDICFFIEVEYFEIEYYQNTK